MKIRLAGEIAESTVDGPGIRYTIFTQGCLHNCPGCHNPKTHSLDTGYLVENDEIVSKMKQNSLISGITLSGGEPFLQPEQLLDLCIKVKKEQYHIIAYSGYTYEELLNMNNSHIYEVLDIIDVLIDGKFEIEKKSLSLLYRGSSNQRIIDMIETRNQKKIILKDYSNY